MTILGIWPFRPAARVRRLPVKHDPLAAPNVDNDTDTAIKRAKIGEYFAPYDRAIASDRITSAGDKSVKYDILVRRYIIATAGIDVFPLMVTKYSFYSAIKIVHFTKL